MSDAIREVLIRYKVEVDRGASAAAMKSLADSPKKLQAEATKAAKETEREEARKWKSIESMDRRAFAARSRLIKEHQTEETRVTRESERLAERAGKAQEQADRRQFAARMQTIKAREAAEQSAAREAEQGANRAARAQETMANKGRAASAKAIEGFRMMTTGLGQAVRTLGYLAASDEKSAEAMAKVVLIVESTIAGLHTLTSVGYGTVKMWQAYKAAQALGGAAGALGGAGRLAGGAAGGGLGGLAKGGGVAALAAPIAGWGALALGGVAAAATLRSAYTGGIHEPGSITGMPGRMAAAGYGGISRMFGYDYGGIAQGEKAEKRLPEYQRQSALKRARADITADAELEQAKLRAESSDQRRQLRPDYMGRGVERYGRAEGTIGAARAEMLTEQRARLLGQPAGTYSVSGEMMQRGQTERARAMESVTRAQALAAQDRRAAEARVGEAGGRVAALRESGAGPEQINRALEHEQDLRQKLIAAQKQEGETTRQVAQLKLESGRNVLQSLTAQRDMLREMAGQARGEQRGAGIRYAELDWKERLKVDEAKRASDSGMKLNPEQRGLMREYGGRALNRRFDEESLRKAPEWIKRANEEEAGGLERGAKQLDVAIKSQYDINVQVEGQLDALGEQVARDVGTKINEFFAQAARMVQEAADRAANEAARRIRDQTPTRDAALRQ